MNVTVRYFASLADAAGCSEETVDASGLSPRALHDGLRERHRWRFGADDLRVAINGRFAAWDASLAEGDEVAFLPPVSGG